MSLIHRYQSNGYNIVLDINSGCIHLVDQVTYEVLPFMEEGLTETEIVDRLKEHFSAEDISTSVRECEKLRNDGMLFTRDAYENVIEEFTEIVGFCCTPLFVVTKITPFPARAP